MPGNTFGNIFRLTTYGESHGHSIGGILDGCPSGLMIDTQFIQNELNRRRPVYPGSTSRNEPDVVDFLSGIMEGKTTGTPIAFQVINRETKSADYDHLSEVYRPSHADFTYEQKYGLRDHRGGGRASGRETVARVVGGALAKILLKAKGVEIHALISQAGPVVFLQDLSSGRMAPARRSPLGCPDAACDKQMLDLIHEAGGKGDTLGGAVVCLVSGVPPGWGEPVFDKLQADLAKAMLSIGSAKGFEVGLGFRSAAMKGSEYNDQMASHGFLTNHDGGNQGGISNGQEIHFRVGFKPVPSIKIPQQTIDKSGDPQEIRITGRHDVCHIPRLVVVVESMAALVLADHCLRNATSRIDQLT